MHSPRQDAMNTWPDRRILDLFGIEVPVIQAPMAGPVTSEMVIAVSDAGGLGSLPCAMINAEQVRSELTLIRSMTTRSITVNLFVHQPPTVNVQREAAWRKCLEQYYNERGVDP